MRLYQFNVAIQVRIIKQRLVAYAKSTFNIFTFTDWQIFVRHFRTAITVQMRTQTKCLNKVFALRSKKIRRISFV